MRSGIVASMSRRPSHWPAKFSVKAAALGSLQHALDLLAERVRLAQLALLGEGEQFLVGHRAPQEVRQPAGQGEVVELAGLLAQEQELRRDQHGLEADAHRLLERVTSASSLAFTRARNGLTSSSVTARRKARRAKSRRIRSASASGCFETTSRRLRSSASAPAPAAGRRRAGDGSAAARSRAAALRPRPTERPAPAPCTSRPRPSRPRAGSRPGRPRRSESCSCGSSCSTNSTTVGLSAGTSK